jgi:hypothetical protein
LRWFALSNQERKGTNEHALIRNVFLPMPFELKMAAGLLSSFYKEDIIKRIKRFVLFSFVGFLNVSDFVLSCSELSGDFERSVIGYVEFVLHH